MTKHGSNKVPIKTSYIIHADDFGKDENVTRAISDVMINGICDETSLMVNMPFADEAVVLAQKCGFLHKVGVHLNLTEGCPLTEGILKCPRFCSEDGKFNMKFHKSPLARIFLSSKEKLAVRAEIDAQLSKFISYPGCMKKIDSHHHVHTNWPIFRILMPLALKYGFKAMRISADLHRVCAAKELYKRIFNRCVRRKFKTTTHFDGAVNVAKAVDGVVEVMVHPVYVGATIFDTRVPYRQSIGEIELLRNRND